MGKPVPSTDSDSQRIRSLDQFRGFTVLAMFVVNFVHRKESVPQVFQHNENWFSLADWIMPGFLFAVGMSFRLTFQRRVEKLGRLAACTGYVRRSLILIFVSLIGFGFGSEFPSWSDWSGASSRAAIAALLKARLWEVLAIIGACQLLLLPIVGRCTRFRIGAAVVFMLCHAALSQWFNVHFVLAQPNVLDAVWGAETVRAWDGGFFGLLSWGSIMLAGTVIYDWLAKLDGRQILLRLAAVGAGCLILGYALSCFATLYDVPDSQGQSAPMGAVASSPVVPSFDSTKLRLAELPFGAIPSSDLRQVNYWMMSKRLVTIPFVLFAVGCVAAALTVFVWGCDQRGFESAILRTLGGNALAAFLLHYVVLHAFEPLLPADAPLWFVLIGLGLFLGVTIGVMQVLERRRLYLRL